MYHRDYSEEITLHPRREMVSKPVAALLLLAALAASLFIFRVVSEGGRADSERHAFSQR
jgi:hypothetical protein